MPRTGVSSLVADYLALTKPRVVSLLLWTTLAAMIAANPTDLALSTVLWTLLGGYLAAGGAGAINHYIERVSDAQMDRTSKRPIATGRIQPAHGLAFGITLGAAAALQLALTVNALAAGLAMAGLAGYVFLYTLWLKPRTPQNIVIGGSAGAIPPLVGWAAATGSLDWPALFMFSVVFMWTPPHFWALALVLREDYERTGVPMMPVVRGEQATRVLIIAYAIVLVALTLLPVLTGFWGAPYLIAAALLGIAFIAMTVRLDRSPSRERALQTYLFSLAYLAVLFAAMAVDRLSIW